MPPQRRQASPLKAIRRSGSSAKVKRKTAQEEDESADEELEESRLRDRGPVHSLSHLTNTGDIVESMKYVGKTMFDDIPERAGMNSTRIAEILNFRRSLPPIVTVPHVQALCDSPTAAEREIATLVQHGVIRRLNIPGRGIGNTAIGECLVLTEHWIGSVESSSHISLDTKDSYLTAIRANPTSTTIDSSSFEPEQLSSLVKAGFLTSATLSSSARAAFSPNSLSQGSLSSLASAGSRAPTGSIAAVGGIGAVHNAGGSGIAGGRSTDHTQRLSFCLPSVGLYLRLLSSGREHLVNLLSKSRHREAPVDLLRERWNGGIALGEKSKSARAGQALVLPGRTRKWKQYYGMKFQWVLEECFGSGIIELFETGSVGLGARLPG